jgi:hypothetical protein
MSRCCPARVVRILAMTIVWLCVPAIALACPVCFQVEDGPVVAGVRAGVGVLIGVTCAVLVGCGAFAVRLVRAEQVPSTREPEHPRA